VSNFLLVLNNLNQGGVQLEALAIAKTLSKKYEVKIFAGSDGNISDMFKKSKLELKIFKGESSKINILEILKFKQYLKLLTNKNTTIISFSVKHTLLLAIINALSFKKHKIIYRHSGMLITKDQGFLIRVRNYLIDLINIYSTHRTICVAQSNSIQLQKLYKCRQKINFCPTFYDTRKFRGRDKSIDKLKLSKILNVEKESFIILCPLSFVKNKNQHEILRIAEKINEDIIWCFCGNGNLLNEFEQLVKKSPKQRQIHIQGGVDNIEVYISGSDLIVSASTYMEGLPQIYSQANFCNTPTIAFDWAGAKDEIKDGKNGYLIEHKNFNQFQKRIMDVYNKETSFIKDFDIFNYDHDENSLLSFINLIS